MDLEFKRFEYLVFFGLLVFSMGANAQMFKCITNNGETQFSQVPCPPGEGRSEWDGNSVKTSESSQVPGDNAVMQRNLRATQIMQGDTKNKSPSLTIVPDSTTGRQSDRDRQARREAQRAAGDSANVRMNCNTVGASTFCRDSEGGRHVSNKIGNTTFTKSVDRDGNVERVTTQNNP